MKTKVTKREVMNGYSEVAEIGYCDLQTVLRSIDAKYYTCGIYGWNSDIYEIGNFAICTGYRPFGTFIPDYKTVRSLEDKAKKIYSNKTWKYETKVRKVKDFTYFVCRPNGIKQALGSVRGES
jgi:hypothetical protein